MGLNIPDNGSTETQSLAALKQAGNSTGREMYVWNYNPSFWVSWNRAARHVRFPEVFLLRVMLDFWPSAATIPDEVNQSRKHAPSEGEKEGCSDQKAPCLETQQEQQKRMRSP